MHANCAGLPPPTKTSGRILKIFTKTQLIWMWRDRARLSFFTERWIFGSNYGGNMQQSADKWCLVEMNNRCRRYSLVTLREGFDFGHWQSVPWRCLQGYAKIACVMWAKLGMCSGGKFLDIERWITHGHHYPPKYQTHWLTQQKGDFMSY